MAALITFAVLWLLAGIAVMFLLIWLLQEEMDGDIFGWGVVFWPIFIVLAIYMWFAHKVLPTVNAKLVRKNK